MTDPAFTLLAVLSVATAIIALEAREVVYGAVSLVLTFLFVAGLFIFLEAPSIAMFQIIVMAGAVAILILFTVMLVHREVWLQIGENRGRIPAILVGVLVTVGLLYVGLQAGLTNRTPAPPTSLDTISIGRAIVVEYWLPLIVLALVLSSAIIGALTLAKLEAGES